MDVSTSEQGCLIDGRTISSFTLLIPNEVTDRMTMQEYREKQEAVKQALRKAIRTAEREWNKSTQAAVDAIIPGGKFTGKVELLSL